MSARHSISPPWNGCWVPCVKYGDPIGQPRSFSAATALRGEASDETHAWSAPWVVSGNVSASTPRLTTRASHRHAGLVSAAKTRRPVLRSPGRSATTPHPPATPGVLIGTVGGTILPASDTCRARRRSFAWWPHPQLVSAESPVVDSGGQYTGQL